MPDGSVSGSVIQRTFVGGDLPTALFAASVPLDEVGPKSMRDADIAGFSPLVAEILAVPSNSLLDESQYQTLVGRLAGRDWSRSMLRYAPDPFWKEWSFAWERREMSVLQEMQSNERPIRRFAEHSIALMVSGGREPVPYWLGLPLPPEEFRRDLELETDETAFATGVACLSARLQRSERTADFTKAVLDYDLPFGHSPHVSSDSLLKLLDSGKKMCLAPMAAGGSFGIGQLSQGQYVAAILSVGTGSILTLILLGTVAVGSLLVTRLAQRR
jgi:hypothetical protein